jgi:hypothetical protein
MAHATRPIDMMNVKRCLAEKPPTTTNQKQSKNLLDVGAALEEGGANIEDHLCVVVDAEVVGVHQLEKHRRREAVAGEHDGHGLAALERRTVRDEQALDTAQDVAQLVVGNLAAPPRSTKIVPSAPTETPAASNLRIASRTFDFGSKTFAAKYG